MDALLFVPVAIAISLTPGPNNFCGLNNGIRAGVGAALIATVGRAASFAIFLSVSAVGLGAMLLASEAAFTAVKWVGAAYLFWLGWRTWRSTSPSIATQASRSIGLICRRSPLASSCRS